MYTTKKKTKGLIFDLDGTLADTMPLHYKAWHMACRKYGINMSSTYLKTKMGRPAWEIGRDIIIENGLEGSVDHEILFKEKIELFKSLQNSIKPIKPVTDIVRKYHGILPMCVGTGAIKDAAIRTLEDIGMSEYFSIIVTAEDVSNHKPHPETFLKCSELMGIDPSTIEVFEDGELGLQAAINAGMTPVDIRPWVDSW
jgi:beta-phosphoglucomutase-like phosphatase (HAD superfamily)